MPAAKLEEYLGNKLIACETSVHHIYRSFIGIACTITESMKIAPVLVDTVIPSKRQDISDKCHGTSITYPFLA